MPRVRLLLAWYDLWVGAFWDARKRRLYLLPVPCVGIVLDFGPRMWTGRELLAEAAKHPDIARTLLESLHPEDGDGL